MKTAQAFVTGATGFIGRPVVRRLLEEGAAVRVLTRRPEKARELFGERVEVERGSLLDAEALRRGLRGVERVYHVGGLYRFGMIHRRELFQANVDGTRRLLEAAWKARVERVVHVGSAGVLDGPQTPLTEENFPASPRFGCCYKNSKWESEREALAWAAKGLPVIIASPTCPLGAGDETPTPTGRIVLDFLRGRFPFAARTGLNFLAVEDLAAGILLCGARGRVGQRYILGHHNVALPDFLRALARETGKPAPRWTLPWPVILAAGAVGEAWNACRPGAGSSLCLETAVQAGRNQFFSSEKARAELAWEPAVSLDACVRDSAAWFCRGWKPETATAGRAASPLSVTEPHVG